MAEKTIDVKNFTNHEFFNYKETSSHDHDISILELAEELDLATPDRENLVLFSSNNAEFFTYENFPPAGKRKGDRSGTWP